MSEEPNNSAEQQPTTPAQPEDVAEMTPADAAGDGGAEGVSAQPESPAPSDLGGGIPESTSTDESAGVDDSAEAPQVAAPTGSGDEPSGAGAVAPEQVTAAVEDAAAPTEPPADDEASPVGGVTVSTEEIEAAMQEMRAAEQPAADGVPADAESGGAAPASADEDAEGVVEAVLDSDKQESIGSAPTGSPAPEAASELPPDAAPFEPQDFAADSQPVDPSQLNLLDDVELDVKVELGRTEMYIEDVLGLGTGSVVELDKAAGDPVDIFVNERLVARGEVLVLNDNFCVRVNDILSPIPELEDER